VLGAALAADHVAVFGASATPGKWGHTVTTRLLEAGFSGKLTLVNPKGGELNGQPLVSAEHAEGAQLAVVTTPAAVVPDVLLQCGEVGIPVAVVQAAGFAEVGDYTLDRKLRAAIEASGVRVIGPNCVGVFSSQAGINTTPFAGVPVGSVSLVSQSGALADHAGRRLAELGAGFDVLLSLGNKVDVNLTDALSVLAERPSTSGIMLYLERLDEGEPFLERLASITPDLPVVAVIGGRTSAGQRASRSHTGSMISSWDRLAALLACTGVQVVEDLALAVAAAAGGKRSGKKPIRKVFALCDGGGEAVLLADALEASGYELSPPSERLSRELATLTGLECANPFDVQGRADTDPGIFAPMARAVLADRQYDALLLACPWGGYGSFWGEHVARAEIAVAAELGALAGVNGSVVIAQSPYATHDSEALVALRAAGIPCLEWAHETVQALNSRNSSGDPADPASELPAPSPTIADPDLGRLTTRIIEGLDSAQIAHAIGYPVTRENLPDSGKRLWVVRADGFTHKAAVGAIEVGVTTPALPESFDRLEAVSRAAGLDPQIRLAPLISHRHELIVSLWRNEREGNGCMLGTGGGAAETSRDIAIGRMPTIQEDADRVLAATRIGARLLREDPHAARAVAELTFKLARLFEEVWTELQELECNPVAVGDEGPYVLDVLPTVAAESPAAGGEDLRGYQPVEAR